VCCCCKGECYVENYCSCVDGVHAVIEIPLVLQRVSAAAEGCVLLLQEGVLLPERHVLLQR
jgi:hypothetical protein